MFSIKLDENNWDLDLDASGNLAAVDEPERLAQDVATTCLLWRGESFWDAEFGVPWKAILGGSGYSLSLVEGYIKETAETVEGVETADVTLTQNRGDRTVKGQILINGGQADVEF